MSCNVRNQGKKMAALQGFEPRQNDPESLVLPLHHRAALKNSYEFVFLFFLSFCEDFTNFGFATFEISLAAGSFLNFIALLTHFYLLVSFFFSITVLNLSPFCYFANFFCKKKRFFCKKYRKTAFSCTFQIKNGTFCRVNVRHSSSS